MVLLQQLGGQLHVVVVDDVVALEYRIGLVAGPALGDRRGTFARMRLRTAERRMSCGMVPAQPAAAQARRQGLRKSPTGLPLRWKM